MLVRKFEEQVQKYPEKIAVQVQGKHLTYVELNQIANQIARSILQICGKDFLEVKPCIGLLFEHGLDMITAMMGALKSALIYTPLDPSYPEIRLQYMVANAEVRLLVTNTKNQELAQQIIALSNREITVVNIDELNPDISMENLNLEITDDQIAYILYTSGSTGNPKGVMQSHRNIWHFIKEYTKSLSLTSEDKLTLFSAFSHDAAVIDIYGGLLNGATLYPLNIKNQMVLSDLQDWLREEKITIWHSVPTVYRFFMKTLITGEQFPTLRFIVLGGEAIRKHDVKIFQNYFAHSKTVLLNLYGQSESSYNSAQYFTVTDELKRITLGESVGETELLVINEEGEEVLPLETGEIIVCSDYIALGYWQNSEKTNEVFMNDPELGRMYLTGDLGRLMLDGAVEYIGRKDFQIKIRGYRVELGEIESHLLKYPGINECAVIAKEDQDGDFYLVAFVVTAEAGIESMIKTYLGKHLPEYMVPTYIVPLLQLPLTPNNKLDRKALLEYNFSMENDQEYIPPTNEIEARLIKIWEKLINKERIGITNSFFELGGHSLKATSLLAEIYQKFGVELFLQDVFTGLTVQNMAMKIEKLLELTKSRDHKSSSLSLDDSDNNLFATITPVAKKEYYPVSSAQKRLYVQYQFEGAGISYNMPGAMIFTGVIERERFSQIFKQLVARHETLRTSFEMINGEIVQKVLTEVDFEISYTEASADELPKILREFVRPFDLSKAPLLRVGLAKLANDQYAMFFDMHHIISDGLSMGILVQEFIALYQGAYLPDLRIQYKDFSIWQNELFKTDYLKKQEKFWLDTFAGDIPVLNLPTDYLRPSIQSFRGDQIKFEIEGELLEQLKALVTKTHSTMYMLLLSAYYVLLYKYSGQEDIIVGSPIAGRRHVDLLNIIGMFVNMIVLRNAPSGKKMFSEFFNEVKENTISVYDNQDYQFEELVEKLNLHRDLSRNPLFDVVFSFQNIREDFGEVQGLQLTPVNMENNISKFDLTLDVKESSKKVWFSLEYCTDLFTRVTAERLAKHYVNILKNIAENPERLIGEFNILSEAEKKQLLEDFNATEMEYEKDKPLHVLITEQAEKTPDKIAIVYDDQKLTYRELNHQANQLAHQLRRYGVERDKIVGIMAERSIEMIVGILGVLKAGGAYMPIDPDYPSDRIRYMLNDSKAIALLIQKQYGTRLVSTSEKLIDDETDLINYQGPVLDLSAESIFAGNADDLENVNTSEDLAYVMYTSGSTGKPKGVMIEQRSVINLSKFYNDMFKLDQDKNILHMSNVSFDTSVVEIFPPLMHGATVYVIKKELALDRLRFMQYVQANQIHFAQFVPMTLQEILGQSEKPACLETIIVGGDKLDDVIKDRIIALGYHLTNHYGPTEATVDAIVAKCEVGMTTIGKPIANTRIYILDRDNNLAPIGVPGELCIAGIGLARGYLNRPDLTTDKFVPNPCVPEETIYRTGDLASWKVDGNITFLGRIDNQVKIRGYRIELGEIEQQLLRHENVTGAVVVDKLDSHGSKYLCSYIVADRELTVAELREYLAQELPDFMIPSNLIQIERIPLTHNGKVDRSALPEPEGTIATGTEYVAPSNLTEQKLIIIWQEVLGVEDLGVKHNFFEVGGHSLKAMALLARIHKEFNVEVPLSAIFKQPTIKELAQYVQNADQSLFTSINPVEEQEYYALSSSQKRIYITWQLNENSTAYNMPTAVILEGDLERQRLESTIQRLMQRHEALRTSFAMVDGEPMQKIHPEIDLDIQYMEAKDSELEGLIMRLIQPYDLRKAPLFRVALIQFAPRKYLLFFDMHHIISDGVSSAILIKDFANLFEGEDLPSLKIQYKDYAAWHNSLLESTTMQKLSEYWLKQLENYTYTELPARKVLASGEMESNSRLLEIDESITTQINEFCIKHKITKFAFMLAVFKIIIMRTINQNDISVGITVAGRRHDELKNIIGVFLNMLIIRTHIEHDIAFNEYLLNVRDHLMEAQEHQDYPYEYLYEKAKELFNFQTNSLFSILFNYMPYQEEESVNLHGITISPYNFERADAKFGLTLYVSEGKDNIYLRAVFSSNLEEAMIQNILNNFENVIKTVVAEDDILIKQITLAGSENLAQFSQEFDMEFDDLEFI